LDFLKSGYIPASVNITDVGNIKDYVEEYGLRLICNEKCTNNRWPEYCINGTFKDPYLKL